MKPKEGEPTIMEAFKDGYNTHRKITNRKIKRLIKFHEDRIEELIKELEETDFKNIWEMPIYRFTLRAIYQEYESIMAIEYWLEDAI